MTIAITALAVPSKDGEKTSASRRSKESGSTRDLKIAPHSKLFFWGNIIETERAISCTAQERKDTQQIFKDGQFERKPKSKPAANQQRIKSDSLLKITAKTP